MKRSSVLYGILTALFFALVATVFIVPQEVLDSNEIYFLLVLALMGFLWIRAYVDSTRGN
jgi:hypothetical protein